MASTDVARISTHSTSFFSKPILPSVLSRKSTVMDERDIFDHLSGSNVKKSNAALDKLKDDLKKNGGRLAIANKPALFHSFSIVLSSSDRDLRVKCIRFIGEIIPQFGDELDACMNIVLPTLVPNLGDSKVAVRREVIQTLHVYMKYTSYIQQIFHSIVKHGLESDDPITRRETTVGLPMLFTKEFADENWLILTQALAGKLQESAGNDNMQKQVLVSLNKIKELVGNDTFKFYVQKLSPKTRRFYCSYTNTPYEENGEFDNLIGSNGHVATFHKRASLNGYEFGIIPSNVVFQLYNEEDWRVRATGVESLRKLMLDLQSINPLLPHLTSFLNLISRLLDDVNFKVVTVALEILQILISKLNIGVKPVLKHIVSALAKSLADTKIVVRQENMRVIMQLMQTLSPRPVIPALCENLKHKNSRVREETLNIVIASLLTFPTYEFDLNATCKDCAMSLIDPKRRVRHAAMECFAVIAQALGPGKLAPLVSAAEQVETTHHGAKGLMAAVQARLARRQLPHVTGDGLVLYATQLMPSSASSGRGNSTSPNSTGTDIDWIMAASSSAGLSRSMPVAGSDHSHTDSHAERPRYSPNGTPHRYRSAGKGKKLPWEDTDVDTRTSNSAPPKRQSLSSGDKPRNAPPPKARNSWNESFYDDADFDMQKPSHSIEEKKDEKKKHALHKTNTAKSIRTPSPTLIDIFGMNEDNRKAKSTENIPFESIPRIPRNNSFTGRNNRVDSVDTVPAAYPDDDRPIRKDHADITSKPLTYPGDANAGKKTNPISKMFNKGKPAGSVTHNAPVANGNIRKIEPITKPQSKHLSNGIRKDGHVHSKPTLAKKPMRVMRDDVVNGDDGVGKKVSLDENMDKPFSNPDSALTEALKLIGNEDWEVKCKGLCHMKRLVRFHHNVFNPKSLHGINLSLNAEMKNLRSSVSRCAIQCMAEMFTQLKKNMDHDLENLSKTLLIKSGETSAFIKEDVEKALHCMVDSVTTQRALSVLIINGNQHKNTVVRKNTAMFMTRCVEKLSADRVMAMSEEVIPAIARCVLDATVETRYFGRRMLHALMDHPQFDKAIAKHLTGVNLRTVNEALENIRVKGVGDVPGSLPSSRANSGGREVRNVPKPGSHGGVNRKSSGGGGGSGEDQARQVSEHLMSGDFRERMKGCDQLVELSRTHKDYITNNLVKLMDPFLPKLNDTNKMVNIHSLECLTSLVQVLKDRLQPVLGMLVPNVCQNISSKNKGAPEAAASTLDAMMEHIDAAILLQPFSNQAQFGNVKVKPDMIDRLAFLVTEIYDKKPRTVSAYVMPAFWSLLAKLPSGAGSGGNLRESMAHLALSLHSVMDHKLIDDAQAQSATHYKILLELLNI